MAELNIRLDALWREQVAGPEIPSLEVKFFDMG